MIYIVQKISMAVVAQSVERQIVVLEVAGSIPVDRPSRNFYLYKTKQKPIFAIFQRYLASKTLVLKAFFM